MLFSLVFYTIAQWLYKDVQVPIAAQPLPKPLNSDRTEPVK